MRTSSWREASWLQPGTMLAKAFKGFLTGRPLHQHSLNFLQGLQLHQDYCSQKDFSTWAGKAPCRVWTMARTGKGLCRGGGRGPEHSLLGLACRRSWEGLGGVCFQGVTPEVRRGHGGKCSMKGGKATSDCHCLLHQTVS